MTRASIADVLLDAGFEVDDAASGVEALRRLNGTRYSLLVTDINMPQMDGITLLGEAMRWAEGVDHVLGAILVTGMSDRETAVKALKLGASDYIVKPFSVDEVLRAVHLALEKRRLKLAERLYERQLEAAVKERTQQLAETLQELESAYDATLIALMAALDARDTDTEGHSQRVARVSVRLGQELGLSANTLTQLYRGALVHDVGKIGIPDAILLKPAGLTPEELRIMRRHPEIGFNILQGVPFLTEALAVVLSHHEWWDGSGYPQQLRGEAIPLLARIFAVVDTFDAMTSDRPYRRRIPVGETRETVLAGAGTHFDPRVVAAFEAISTAELAELSGLMSG